MKKIILFSALFISFISAYSQDRVEWNIVFNKKRIFSATEENEQKNILPVKSTDLKSNKNFVISYLEINASRNKNEWKRTIGVYNDSDKELIRKDTAILNLTGKQIKKMLLENKIIKIYSWALPKDPKEAARVRIRRVHLCTILLK